MLGTLLFMTLAVAPEAPATTDAQLEQMLAPIRASDAALDSDKQIPPPFIPKGQKRPPAPPPPAEPVVAPPPPSAAELELARAEAIETVAIMRALAATRRLDAVDPIFKLAFEYDGVF